MTDKPAFDLEGLGDKFIETQGKLLDRTIALQSAINFAQSRQLPSLEVVNQWRNMCGLEPIESFPRERDV